MQTKSLTFLKIEGSPSNLISEGICNIRRHPYKLFLTVATFEEMKRDALQKNLNVSRFLEQLYIEHKQQQELQND